MARRGARMLQAVIDTAPIPVVARETYVGDCEILVTYGTGHPVRRPWWQQHRAKGGRCIGWDLGYWWRDEKDPGMRCTLDTDHPPQWMREEPPERWDSLGVALREDAGTGPVLMIGQTRKSIAANGESPLAWERKMLSQLKGRRVIFRPKHDGEPVPRGVEVRKGGTIEQALRGVSLVVCRHSNVAIDACIAGVPVVCDSGAASALYGNDLCNPTKPTPEQRLSFLHSLAWWNWRRSEAAQAWEYLLSRIAST